MKQLVDSGWHVGNAPETVDQEADALLAEVLVFHQLDESNFSPRLSGAAMSSSRASAGIRVQEINQW